MSVAQGILFIAAVILGGAIVSFGALFGPIFYMINKEAKRRGVGLREHLRGGRDL